MVLQPHPPVWKNETVSKEIQYLVGRGVIGPGDTCTKTGCLIQEALWDNHTPLQKIYFADPINSTFEMYDKVQDTVSLDIYVSNVEVLVFHLGVYVRT